MPSQEVREQRKLRQRLAREDQKAKYEAMQVIVPEKKTVPWKAIQSNPDKFLPWFSNKITSFEELASRCEDAAFIAFDTEYRQWRDPSSTSQKQKYSQCTEIGWALLTNLLQPENIPTANEPSIASLVRRFDIQVKNMQVKDWCRGGPNVPVEDFPYGVTDHAGIEELDDKVDSHLQCLKEHAKGRPLILVGFNVRIDLQHLWRDFPTAARHISAWVDLEALWKGTMSHRVPAMGLGSVLRHLGYKIIETPDLSMGRRHHIAAMDAVRTLALLEAMTSANEEVTTRLLPGEKPNFPTLFVLERPWACPTAKFQLQITGVQGGPEGLPREIESVLKLANFVYDRGNLAAAIGGYGRGLRPVGSADEPIRAYRGVRAGRRQAGFLEFTDEDKMRRFLRAANDWSFDGEKLAIRILFDPMEVLRVQQEATNKRLERENRKRIPPPVLFDMQEDFDGGLEGFIPNWM